MKKLLIAALLVGVTLASLAWLFVPEFAWRARLLRVQALGRVHDLGWVELLRMMMPGSGYYVLDLSETGNPFSAIVNLRDSQADIDTGAQLYRARCSACRGADAGGGTGPALSRSTASRKDSDWRL